MKGIIDFLFGGEFPSHYVCAVAMFTNARNLCANNIFDFRHDEKSRCVYWQLITEESAENSYNTGFPLIILDVMVTAN